MRHKIICGHVLDVLKTLPDESVDTIVTSPPYWGLRDYGEETNTIWGGDPDCEHEWISHSGKKLRGTNDGNWKESIPSAHLSGGAFCKKCGAWYGQLGLEPTLDMYIEHLLEIMRELKRVLRKTGVIFWNHGDCYGSHSIGKGNVGGIEGKRRQEDSKYASNISGQSLNKLNSVKDKCMALQNFRFIIRCVDELGLILRNVIIWHKPNHMPSSVKDRFTSAYEPIFMLVKSKKYWFDLDAVRVPQKPESLAMAGKQRGRKEGYPGNWATFPKEQKPHPLGKNPGDVWAIPTQPFPEAHFAVYPEKLVEPMIKAACPQEICKKCGKPRERIVAKKYIQFERPTQRKYIQMVEHSSTSILKTRALPLTYIEGWTDCGCNAGWESGVVLDPFLGSGTTALVALKLGRRFVGIEINREYCEMALRRIEPYLKQKRIGDFA